MGNNRRRQGSEGMTGTSRFAVTCALLRQYMRKHQGQMGDLARLFQFPAPPLPPPEEKDDRTMQLFPVGVSMSPSAQERPEVTTDRATMAIFCHVPQQAEQAQMRAESLHRFLKRKRKIRMSEANPDHNDDSTTPAKKHEDTAAGMPFLDMDVPDPSWLSL